MRFTCLLLAKEAAAAIKEVLLPLRHVRWVNCIRAGQLAERLLFFERLQRNLELAFCAPALPLVRHDPSTCAVQILRDLYIARGPSSGTNHSRADGRCA